MKNLVKTSLILLALVSMLFTSCKKEYEIPPIYSVPVGQVLTIDSILTMPDKTTFDTASVFGIVTGDEVSGNLYKVLFIQDRATGKAIELKLSSASAARIGDSVRVCLDPSIMYYPYHNLPQLVDVNEKGINPDKHLLIYPYNNPIKPKTTTIAEIMGGEVPVGALVKLNTAEFRLKNAPFCEVGETTNRVLDDDSYMNTTDDPSQAKFVVRTSNYANFAYDYMPVSKGSLVAIASIYNSTYQLLIRSKSELEFSEWGHPTTPAGELQSMPYIQSFASNFGTYVAYDVEGPQSWTIDYSTAKMTGYANSTNYVNEDWLISSPVAVTGVDHAKVAVAYVAQYQNSNTNDVTLQVSTDYEYGKNPTEATWKQMDATYPNTSGWQDFQTVETSLDEFIGQNITVAIKFTSTDSQSRTMEVQSITVQEGEASGGGGSGELTGDGTRENPYTASDVIILHNSVTGKHWVRGYVVGVIDNGNNNSYEFTNSTTVASNIIIADDMNTTVPGECVAVQLVGGTAVRAGLNLVDNPVNYQMEVLVYGSLENYFSQPGVKGPSYAEINGNSYGTDPGAGGGVEYFNEDIASQTSFDVFTTYSVTGDQEWHFDPAHATYGAQISGFANSTSYANEDWLVSPAIDLSASTNPVLVFDHTRGPANSINVGVTEGYYTVWASNNYTDGDPNQVQWTELTGVNHATAAWSWVSSGNVSIPAEFKTSTCRIALKYLSVDGASATWEVKNIVVREQ